jgi:hypothetical protein
MEQTTVTSFRPGGAGRVTDRYNSSLKCLVMFHSIENLNKTYLLWKPRRCITAQYNKIRDSSVGIAMGYGMEGRGLITGRGRRFFPSSQRPG